MLSKIEAGLEKKPLTDVATKKKLQVIDGKYIVTGDVQFPTTSAYKVDGKKFPITMTSSNTDVVYCYPTKNAARVVVYQPELLVEDVVVTITMTNASTGVSASKDLVFSVQPTDADKIQKELELMNKAKESYATLLLGSNTSANEVTSDLNYFFEIYEQDGELETAGSSAEKTGQGIIPTPGVGWEIQEKWRLFKSSNPKVVSHENLSVTPRDQPTKVTVTSWLSSETYGKYGELYYQDPVTYAAYEPFKDLYNQEVTAEFTVRGLSETESGSFDDSLVTAFSLDTRLAIVVGNTLWYSGEYKGLPDGVSAYEIFRQVAPVGSYEFKGTYLSGVRGPDGNLLSEKDKGPNSGWLYSVNGEMPSVGLGDYYINDGDSIVVFYTEDGSVFGHWEWPNDEPSVNEPSVNEPSVDEPSVNWVQVDDVKPTDVVEVTTKEGVIKKVQPLVSKGRVYLPMAKGDTYKILPTEVGEEKEEVSIDPKLLSPEEPLAKTGIESEVGSNTSEIIKDSPTPRGSVAGTAISWPEFLIGLILGFVVAVVTRIVYKKLR